MELPPVPAASRAHSVSYVMQLRSSKRSPGTGVTDSCELPCGFWDLNPGPLEEQPVLLTAEPSLQPPETCFKGPKNPPLIPSPDPPTPPLLLQK
ncbi:hypothetical protein STEG23_012106, partial [Scotinomys teguina]